MARIALVLAILIILYATLNPFDFQFSHLTLQAYLAGFALPPSSPFDFPRNVLLFMPFGFALAALTSGAGWTSRRMWQVVGVTGFLLTWLVESAQSFLPMRTSSVSDLVSNTLGALAGAALYQLWQQRDRIIILVRRTLASARAVALILALYSTALLLIAWLLGTTTSFGAWSSSFPLMIGGESRGGRTWRGIVSDVAIFNQALTEADTLSLLHSGDISGISSATLLANYRLTGTAPLTDHTGQQPDLAWHAWPGVDGSTPRLDGKHWLKSVTAVTKLSENLRDTSQVTVALTAASASPDQYGPARILSISDGTQQRNLTVAQDGPNLALRLNTAVGGLNGIGLEMRFPNQFVDAGPIVIVLRYDGLRATLHSSAAATQTLELLPGPAFAHYLRPDRSGYWILTVSPLANWLLHLLYYLLLFLPLGFILGAAQAGTWPPAYRTGVWAWGLGVLPLLAETALLYHIGYPPRSVHLLTALGCVILGALVLPRLFYLWQDALQDRAVVT